MLTIIIRTARRALRRHSNRKRRAAYNAYMQSAAWQQKRQEAFDWHGRACQECGSRGPLQVHHIHYKTFGRERMQDLRVLCVPCHRVADRQRKKARWF